MTTEIRERDVATRKTLRFTCIGLTLVPKLLLRVNEINREEYVDNVTLYKVFKSNQLNYFHDTFSQSCDKVRSTSDNAEFRLNDTLITEAPLYRRKRLQKLLSVAERQF